MKVAILARTRAQKRSFSSASEAWSCRKAEYRDRLGFQAQSTFCHFLWTNQTFYLHHGFSRLHCEGI
jgi:hypothetical protein